MPIKGMICGPTGIGKSDFSIKVALKHGFEIISVDAFQVYQGVEIGTAQVKNHQNIPHHLMGILPFGQIFSVLDFKNKIKELLKKQPKTHFLLVGGSGFYVKTLFSKEKMKGVEASEAVKKEVKLILNKEGSLGLYQRLKAKKDPRVKQIHPNDSYRLVKAYEYRLTTGQSYVECQKNTTKSISLDFPSYVMLEDRDYLYKKINQRVLKMLEDGWVNEVIKLKRKYPTLIREFKALGYREILHNLDGGLNKSQMIGKIQKLSRHLAKRQETFFKHQFLGLEKISVNQNPLTLSF